MSDDYESGTGRYQAITTSTISWTAARDAASTMTNSYGVQGHLVTITSAAEMAVVQSIVPSGYMCWIGATDERSEGTWEWVTGETLSSYTNWMNGEPNNSGGNEDYAAVSLSWYEWS